MEKLKKQLAEAEALKQTQKVPQDDKATILAAPWEGVIDEWVSLALNMSFCTVTYVYAILPSCFGLLWRHKWKKIVLVPECNFITLQKECKERYLAKHQDEVVESL